MYIFTRNDKMTTLVSIINSFRYQPTHKTKKSFGAISIDDKKGQVNRVIEDYFKYSYGCVIMSMGFALGTQNSATAIRHRAKILPALLIVIVFVESIKHNRSYIWNDRKID